MNLAILFAVGLIGLSFYAFVNQEPYDASRGDRVVTVDGTDELDPLQRELKAQRARSQELAKLGKPALEKMEWSDEDRTVAFRFGPRKASELVCRQLADEIRSGKLDTEMRLELEKTLDRRTEFAPWTCMTRAYLAASLPDGELQKEMDEFWGELEAHQGNPRLPISIIEDIRQTRERPKNPKFWSWTRMCAFDFEYQAAPECRRLLYQVSPKQGADILLMLETHWAEGGLDAEQLPSIVAGLGRLARNGQPHNWKVEETDELPDYDVDLRQAAVGYLCRMVNTPTPDEREGLESKFDRVPTLAANQLRKVGLVGARSNEKRLLLRWRETCRLAFGGSGGYNDDEYVAVPLLAVWDGDLQGPPDYRIATAIERGVCEETPGYPAWFCLADHWTDEERSLDRAVAHYFIETRYMEWDDSFDPPTETPDATETTGDDSPSTPKSEKSKKEEPEAAEPPVKEPEAAAPGAEESEPKEPEPKEPETKEPEVTEPDAKEPEPKEPDVQEPEESDAEAEEPAATGEEPDEPTTESE